MNKKKKRENYNLYPVLITLPVILIAVLVFMGYGVWREYRDALLQNQKEQLLITSQTLGKGISISLTEYEENLKFLCGIEEGRKESDEFYRQYLEAQDSFLYDLFWEDEKGQFVKSIQNSHLENPIFVTEVSEGRSIWQYEDEDGRKFLVIKGELTGGEWLCLVIDEESYYEELISDIHVGTNGYVMIKNSEGLILMHPEREQWGIKVIEGRKNLFPDLDYSSLEEMVEEQISGGEGITEYYSYWWTDPELPRVKKVSAYAPAAVGNDFWVISAVIDYDDLYAPIAQGFVKIILIFCGILIIFLALAVCVGRLLLDKRKASREITYLKELNSLLEEVHRSEETIVHQQRLQIMGTMTGGIAHEFNNFLTPIMGHAELLMMELPEDSEEYESAQEIYEASEKAKDVVRQISSLSRRNVETVYKSIPIGKMLTRALKMMESVCPAQIHLEREIQVEEEQVLGNVTQINQVLLNICVNAVHAIGKQEGRICVSGKCVERAALEEIPVLEVSGDWERYLQIDIEDNGCGMDKETLKQIFDPFFTTKKSGEGTGLGLALAEQIIRSHKGYIYAESEPGKGSCFHIYLPVMEVNDGLERFKQEQKPDMRIVIADDNAKILKMLEKNFAKLRLPVVTCMRKEELLCCLKEQEMDVLVIDESLEDGSGIDFCMAIQGKYPDMLKIVMTDCVTREIADAKQKKVIDEYIEKPVSDTTILEAVRNCLEKY